MLFILLELFRLFRQFKPLRLRRGSKLLAILMACSGWANQPDKPDKLYGLKMIAVAQAQKL